MASKRSPYSLLGGYDWGQAGMRPGASTRTIDFWASLGSVLLIAAAVLASAIL
jgi:hypothetical protein